MEDKKLIDLIMFHVNEKANTASGQMRKDYKEDTKNFHRGQYMAFNEVYSMLTNIKKTI